MKKNLLIRRTIFTASVVIALFLSGCGAKQADKPETAASLLEKMAEAVESAGSAEAEIHCSGKLERTALPATAFDFELTEQLDFKQFRSWYTGSGGLQNNGIEMDLPMEAVLEKNGSPPMLYLKLMDIWAKQTFPLISLDANSGFSRSLTEKATLQEEPEIIQDISVRALSIDICAKDLAAAMPSDAVKIDGEPFASSELPFLLLKVWISEDTFLPIREKATLLNSLSTDGSVLTQLSFQRDYTAFGKEISVPFPEEAFEAIWIDDLY